MTEERAGRRRDSARSREVLLQTAMELFAEHGFERTTTRDIGERAGVDAALIARYFGSKTQLYLATLSIDSDAEPEDLLNPERLLEMLERTDQRGLGPHSRIVAQPLTDPQAQQAARAGLHERLVEPLCKRFTSEGLTRPGCGPRPRSPRSSASCWDAAQAPSTNSATPTPASWQPCCETPSPAKLPLPRTEGDVGDRPTELPLVFRFGPGCSREVVPGSTSRFTPGS